MQYVSKRRCCSAEKQGNKQSQETEKIRTQQVCSVQIQSGIERQSKIEIKGQHYHGIKCCKQEKYLK